MLKIRDDSLRKDVIAINYKKNKKSTRVLVIEEIEKDAGRKEPPVLVP